MDSAKCIAFGVKKEDSIANYFGAQPAGEVLPIVLITTTAGTGSEANNYAVMTNPETQVKKHSHLLILLPGFQLLILN
jgi:alcohol dehydrogenase